MKGLQSLPLVALGVLIHLHSAQLLMAPPPEAARPPLQPCSDATCTAELAEPPEQARLQ